MNQSRQLEPEEDEPRYRYRVLETWGDVPKSMAAMIGAEETYLLYDRWMGNRKHETLYDLRTGRASGGWLMTYAGMRP